MIKKIFISQRLDEVGKFNEKRNNLDVRFLEIFEKLNMIPILIPNNTTLSKKIIKNVKVSGIILSPGGDALKKDIRYDTEILLLNYAKKNDIPLLGICRGAQAINIYFGGKIKVIQNHVRKKHILKSDLTNKKNIKTNCYHDYGIKSHYLAKNLQVLGTSSDNSIELFKHKSKKIMGMMWHPERFKKLREFELKIFKGFF
ncbi:gamma-glutamyl-gamma-aminobutyrate hydrolase family protein [Candidatus Pelagibacter sp.]|jgi:N5-(cytidine 5'-diphosphoramidyl)-L-glutamine hydrolase|nr:gamma-glutamyl-gamma-aminobutyrate hydrolase family protein [Candidatus Pelagibacter sp.]